MEEVPVFRPPKRQKFQRPSNNQETEVTHSQAKPVTQDEDLETLDYEGAAAASSNISTILKLRRQNRSRATGVKFSNISTNLTDDVPEAAALSLNEPAGDTFKAISDRFVGYTGQVVDVDNHMMAYVDSEMAKRRATPLQPPSKSTHTSAMSPATSEFEDESSSTSSSPKPSSSKLPPIITNATRNAASLGKIDEIDLGPSAHHHAALLTSAALARQSDPNRNNIPADEDVKPRRPRKPRLGRDGKPLKPRPRKRRPSADIARDALVEQVLRESRLEIYDGPGGGSTASAPNVETATGSRAEVEDEGDAADERVAEQFRQDFMDAMANRQRRHAAPAKPKAGTAESASAAPRGPKLGGSRSARAAMRERELRAAQAGKNK